MFDLIQNQRMVDLSGLPPYPGIGPDPHSVKDFAEWLRELIRMGGLKQKDIAAVAGATPQAVTKWLQGKTIEPERLVRIAEWSGFPYEQLRRLVDERKIGLMRSGVSEAAVPVFHDAAAAKAAAELMLVWPRLTADSRQQLLGMANLLLARQGKRR